VPRRNVGGARELLQVLRSVTMHRPISLHGKLEDDLFIPTLVASAVNENETPVQQNRIKTEECKLNTLKQKRNLSLIS